MEASGKLAAFDHVAELGDGFKEPVLRRVAVIVLTADIEDAGRAVARVALIGRQDADMDEQVAEASFGDAEGGWGDSAGSAEFRAEGDDALALRAAAGGGVSAGPAAAM